MYACRHGHLEIVKILIDSGANLNLRGNELAREGYTALIYSAYNGHQKIVEALVEAGADVNIQNTYEQTALIISSEQGHLETVKVLIEAGADVNLQGQAEWTIEKGWTALIHASRVGHLEVVKSLIDAGADLRLKTAGGWTALKHALNQKHKEVVKVLEDAASKKARDSDPGNRNCKSEFGFILIDQASRGNLRAVKDLIDAGVDLNLQDKDKSTALVSASLIGRLEIVKTLVDAGADVNVQSKNAWTALIAASKVGHLEIVEFLVDAGADVNFQNKYGETALMHASRAGHLEIVKTLIQVGANIDVQDENEWTALMYASDQGYKEVVEVLQAAASGKTRDSDPSDPKSPVIFTSLFTALGYLSKVDGKVSQEEISFVTNGINEMQLDAEQRRQAEELFRMGKQAPAIALMTLLSNLKNEYENDCESLQEFMRILIQLIHVDHVISEQERLAIKEIAGQLEIEQSVLNTIEDSLFSKSKGYQRSTSSHQSQHSKRDNQSTEKAKKANPNHSKLVKMSADLFEISGYLAKLDGRISREEIKAITALMNEMQLEKDQRRQAENLFRRGKQPSEENMLTLVSNLQEQYHDTPEVLNILVMILMQVAYSDGEITDPEQQMIRTIAMQLSFDEVALGIIEAAVCCEIQNIKYLDLHDAYKMIGVSDTASHHDIKKARLRLLRTYHPDALQAKGLPKEMLVFGKRLSQTFNLAYDRIKADRKF